MDGYIRLNRKFFKNAYWSQKRAFSLSEAWLDLIQMARFDAEPATKILPNGRMIKIERGEIHSSLRFLSDRWGWGVEKTLRYINKHIKEQEIERRTEQGESIIKLCNYDTYNPLSNTDQNTGRTPTDTNNKKDKERKKREINNPPIIPLSGDDGELSFENVWILYGRKGNKKTSRARWDKLTLEAKKLARAHIPDYVDSTPDEQYRKNFEVYISREGWNDRIIKKPQSNGKTTTGNWSESSFD